MSKGIKVIVVGGGAAGMMAAISARRLGAEVTILEKNPRVGKKILATGNGRCNFTNMNAGPTCYHGNNPQFVVPALEKFSVKETLKFFEDLGIAPKVEERGKVFPMSDQASSFLDVLLYELQELEINTICEAEVTEIKKEDGTFRLRIRDGREFLGDKVILTPGGKAMPSSGSDGKSYDLVRKFGHTIVDIFPALVQIMLEGPFFKRIQGVKLVGTAEIIHNDKSLVKDRGDILFTNYGVSGPPILQISRKAGELLQDGEDVYLKINILDTIPKEDLRKFIAKRLRTANQKPLDFSLVGLINKRLIPVILAEAGFKDLKRPAVELSNKERETIVNILTDWRFKIRGTKGWQSAQVTAGGVDTREINPETMESKIVKGLYLAGEILDIDGLCGGFNLQWAWSSGYVAGQSAVLH
jgi:predicted Rossmann fold flavoprotein